MVRFLAATPVCTHLGTQRRHGILLGIQQRLHLVQQVGLPLRVHLDRCIRHALMLQQQRL